MAAKKYVLVITGVSLVIGAMVLVWAMSLVGAGFKPAGDKIDQGVGHAEATQESDLHAIRIEECLRESFGKARNAQDLLQTYNALVGMWTDVRTTEDYIDNLFAKQAHVSDQGIAWIERDRQRHPEHFPADDQWFSLSPEEQFRLVMQWRWSMHAPFVDIRSDDLIVWVGEPRAPPASVSKSTIGMTSRCLPPGMTAKQVQESSHHIWMRISAIQTQGKHERVVDLRFVYVSSTDRWYPAEARVYGQGEPLLWGL
jgi:hypothetical protein